jgi:hypothetical protein
MEQAEAAARALEAETENLPLMRALETAIAVCDARAFTKTTLGTLSPQYVPVTPPDSDLHAWFRDRRDKEYAHTDKKGSRIASVEGGRLDGNVVTVMLREQSEPSPRELIALAIELFQRQRHRLREEGTREGVRPAASSRRVSSTSGRRCTPRRRSPRPRAEHRARSRVSLLK